MDLINEIIRQSPIGAWSKWHKSLVISLFSSIVLTCLLMLMILFIYGTGAIEIGY